MKKYIILLLLAAIISNVTIAQIDTSKFVYRRNSADGKYSSILTKVGGISANLQYIFDMNIDTSRYNYLRNQTDGKYDRITNKIIIDGKPTGSISANLIYLLNNNIATTDASHTFTATQYFNKIFVDTLIANNIDSVHSTYWYSNTGDTIGYIDAATEKVAFFKQMTIGNLSTNTTVAENFIRSNQVQTDTIYPHSPLILAGDTTIARKLFADTVKAKGIEIGTIRQGRNIIQEGITLMYINNLVIRDSITGYNRLFLTRFGELCLASSGRFCLTDYNNAQGPVYSSIGSTGNNNMTFYGGGLGGSNVIFSYNNTAVTFNTPIALNGINTPSNPTAGMIYYNSSDNHFYGYNGTIWKQLDN